MQYMKYRCDVTGEEGAEPVEFYYDGEWYRIDLNPKLKQEHEEHMTMLIEHATVFVPETEDEEPDGRRRNGNNQDTPFVRAWAARKGLDVAPRGRIRKEIWEDWWAAGSPRVLNEDPSTGEDKEKDEASPTTDEPVARRRARKAVS